MKRLKKRIISLVVILVSLVGLIFLSLYLKSVNDYQQSVKEISFDEIDILDVADGIYIGECNVNYIYAKVEVTIQNGVITSIIILEHKNERGKPAEAVIDEIIAEQRIDVDAVSGATNSSTVLKKAVENALAGTST